MNEHGPLSWRDVYKAVHESEARVVEAIRDAVKPLNERQNDHEQRIRSLEVHGSVEAQAALAEVRALAIKHEADIASRALLHEADVVKGRGRIDALEDRINAYDAREKGVLATITFGQKVIIVLGAVLGAVLAVLNIANIASGATQ
jgi:Arc/MetJ-type ribon-helix-helix transcriptional regulator